MSQEKGENGSQTGPGGAGGPFRGAETTPTHTNADPQPDDAALWGSYKKPDWARFRHLVEIMAAERVGSRVYLFDDAVQEGMIAAWSAARERPGKPMAYYHAAARYGVVSVLRGRSMTGAESRQGRRDVHDDAVPMPDEIEGWSDPLAGSDAHADVLAVLGQLEPRDRALVFGRYWLDLGFADLSLVLGRPSGTLAREWSTRIRPLLANQLAAWA